MQNYNNYGNGNYRNINPVQNTIQRNNAIGSNNGWNAGAFNGIGYQNDNYPMGGYQANNYNQPQTQIDYRVFVAGRIGADAYQLQPGVNVQVLWDDDADRFYIKGYDDKGRPRVLGDFDFQPHIEKDTPQSTTDMSAYATKDDIEAIVTEIVADALKKSKQNTSKYVTIDAFNKALSELSVGSGGRVVRANESDA